MADALIQNYKNACISHMQENLKRIERCVTELNEDELWNRSNVHTNSVGNLILHLNGNISQYIGSSLGKEKDERKRETEFDPKRRVEKEKLMTLHKQVVSKACDIILNTHAVELGRKRWVQGFHLTGTEILLHVVEHYSYHTGQIALLVKQQNVTDLGFYKNIDLNIKNEESKRK